ncbi:hypothetical protein D9M68_583830 [compost metagenome]
MIALAQMVLIHINGAITSMRMYSVGMSRLKSGITYGLAVFSTHLRLRKTDQLLINRFFRARAIPSLTSWPNP